MAGRRARLGWTRARKSGDAIMTADDAGDPPCWAHLFDAMDDPPRLDASGVVVVDVGAIDGRGAPRIAGHRPQPEAGG